MERTEQRQVVSLLVDNQTGVLARVSSLFCRRGFNIESLTVSATNDPTVSRITVTVYGDERRLDQLLLQTERLEVTRQVFVLDEKKALQRELLLLKVAATVANRAELREIASIYKAKIIDLSPDSMIFELTGKPEKIDAFLRMFEGYTILEQCRTGVTRPGAGRDASAHAKAAAGGAGHPVPPAGRGGQLPQITCFFAPREGTGDRI